MTASGVASDVERFLEAWFAVRQFIQASNFNRFRGAGLSATQFMTLNLIPEQGLPIGDLARRMNLKPATVAKTVDSLESRGMLERTRDAADRRIVMVQITESGKDLVNNANGQFRRQMGELFSEMASGERAGLVAGMERLVAQMKTGDADPPHSEDPQHSGQAMHLPTRDDGAAQAKRNKPQSHPR